MQKTGSFLILILLLCVSTICSAQKQGRKVLNDFTSLTGNWQGSLTYLDYSSGKSYTMPADVVISRLQKTNKIIFSNIYPNEKSANSIDTVTIANEGDWVDREKVISRERLQNGHIKIVTEERGKDGNDDKQATFRHTYTIGKTSYSKKKEVRFEGSTDWIKRHEYTYTRSKN